MRRFFDEMDLDILKEISNIGAGNAATALSELVQSTIDIGVARCEIIPYSHIAETLSGPENIVAGVLVQMSGDLEGFILMAQTLEDAEETMRILLGQDTDLHENDPSALYEALEPLKEVGNIICGSYLAAVSTMTGLSIIPSVPEMAVDMAMSIMNVPVAVYGEMGEDVLLVETGFENMNQKFGGHFFLMPTPESYTKLRGALLGC